jgi:hypothetical protein
LEDLNMGDKRDEVISYCKACKRIVEQWQNDTEKHLKLDLDSINKELAELARTKSLGPDEKKQFVELHKVYLDKIDKRLILSTRSLVQKYKRLKRPELDDSDPQYKAHKRLLEEGEKNIDDKVDLKLPDVLPDEFKRKFPKKIQIVIDSTKTTSGMYTLFNW